MTAVVSVQDDVKPRLSSAASESDKVHALSLLGTLMDDNEIDTDIIAALGNMLSNTTPENDNFSLELNILFALSTLAAMPSSRLMLSKDSDTLSQVASRLTSGDALIVQLAIEVIQNIALDPRCSSYLIVSNNTSESSSPSSATAEQTDSSKVSNLLSALESSRQQVRNFAIYVFRVLIEYEELRHPVVTSGAVPHLLAVMKQFVKRFSDSEYGSNTEDQDQRKGTDGNINNTKDVDKEDLLPVKMLIGIISHITTDQEGRRILNDLNAVEALDNVQHVVQGKMAVTAAKASASLASGDEKLETAARMAKACEKRIQESTKDSHLRVKPSFSGDMVQDAVLAMPAVWDHIVEGVQAFVTGTDASLPSPATAHAAPKDPFGDNKNDDKENDNNKDENEENNKIDKHHNENEEKKDEKELHDENGKIEELDDDKVSGNEKDENKPESSKRDNAPISQHDKQSMDDKNLSKDMENKNENKEKGSEDDVDEEPDSEIGSESDEEEELEDSSEEEDDDDEEDEEASEDSDSEETEETDDSDEETESDSDDDSDEDQEEEEEEDDDDEEDDEDDDEMEEEVQEDKAKSKKNAIPSLNTDTNKRSSTSTSAASRSPHPSERTDDHPRSARSVLLSSSVKQILVGVHTQPYMYYDSLVLRYAVPADGSLWDAHQFVLSLSEALSSDHTKRNSKQASYESAIIELKDMARDERMNFELNRLYFFLQLTDSLWSLTEQETQEMETIQTQVLQDDAELVIKGWPAISFDLENSKRRHMMVILTDRCLYLVVYARSSKGDGEVKVLSENSHEFRLEHFFLADIGKVGHYVGLRVIAVDEKQQDAVPEFGSASSASDLTRKRPSSDGLPGALIMPPHACSSDQVYNFLEEIAWSLYFAVCCKRERRGHEPFYATISETLSSPSHPHKNFFMKKLMALRHHENEDSDPSLLPQSPHSPAPSSPF